LLAVLRTMGSEMDWLVDNSPIKDDQARTV